MSNPLVSIIVPCYNAGLFITEALESILGQTYQNIEIIIINDGSTDDSVEKIKKLSDPRIQLFHQENKGQCAALNAGIASSRGEYIKFFDADDIMCSEHIELQVKTISGRKDVVASCEWYRFFNNDISTAVYAPETVWENLPPLTWLKTALTQQYDMMAAWLWLIPRQMLDEVGYWDERLSLNNDFEFSVRLLLHAKEVLFTKGAKVYYRSGRGEGLSESTTETAYEAAILSTDLACSYLLLADQSDLMRQICADRYQEWCFRIYPKYPKVLALLEKKVIYYGGSNREMEGGTIFQKIASSMGWKAAKRIKFFFYRLGYLKILKW